MEEVIQLFIKTYGLLGVLIAAPFVAIFFLWKENKVIRKELEISQQKRVEDNKEMAEEVLAVVKEQSSLNKETNILLERLSYLYDREHRN